MKLKYIISIDYFKIALVQMVFIIVHLIALVSLQNLLNVKLIKKCVVLQAHHGILSLLQIHVIAVRTSCVWDQQVFQCVVLQDFNSTN